MRNVKRLSSTSWIVKVPKQKQKNTSTPCFVPEKARWDNLKTLHHDIGAELNKATEGIAEENPVINRVLTTIGFNIKDTISHFSKYRLRNDDFENPDLSGSAYEYLIKMFADSAGKKGGAFYTPDEVVRLLVVLIKPSAGMKVYDPTVGSGEVAC